MSDLRKKLYNLFDPEPCEERFYVDLDSSRGSTNLVRRLADDFRLSGKPTCKLLAGHRGSGKSSELIRLKKDLENGSEKYFVVLFDSVKDGGVDPLDVDFPDMLISIITNIARQFKERLRVNLQSGYFKELFMGIKDILTTPINFESIELNTGLISLSGSMQKNPDFRRAFRDKTRLRSDQWIGAANSIIHDGISESRKHHYSGLIILVDGLDKILMNPDLKERSGAENLFDNWHVQLKSFECHILYTIPLALAYSCSERNIAANFGITAPPVVPMTKLYGAGKTKTEGFAKFRDIVSKRVESVGATMKDVFADESGHCSIVTGVIVSRSFHGEAG